MRDFHFAHTRVWTGDLWISSSALYHCAKVISVFHLWKFQVFNPSAEGLVVVLFWLDPWKIFFLPTPGFELGSSGSLVLHSITVAHANFRFSPLTISGIEVWCRGIGGGIVLIGPMKDFLFVHTRVWTWELWISSPALYHCATVISGFHLWQFQVLNSGAEGLEVVLFWLDPWKIFNLPTPGFELGTSGSLVLHSATLPSANSGFHFW